MKSIVISSCASGQGKTTVTMGIMKVLIKRGFSVQGYKVGPDYIDTAFHERITKIPSRNLDIFLMGEEGVKASYNRGHADIGIIEGAMGLYDGKGVDTKYSTAHIAKLLDIPVVLVVSPKGKSTTICAEINGMVDFGPSNISGVILNNISKNYYRLLKAAIGKYCNVKVFGFIPKDMSISLESRYLGLVQSMEVKDLDCKIDRISKLIEENIDIDDMLKYFEKSYNYKDKFHLEWRNMKIAVAYDEAFNFYYRENLEILSELGNIFLFSPIRDRKLPDNIDFLYIGGGYPEVFAEKLSRNIVLMSDIKGKLETGLSCYAECGGLMYLMNKMQNSIGKNNFNMVGFLNGESFMSKELQNFGYANIKVFKDNKILGNGLSINCHEFHKSCVESNENKIYRIVKSNYDGSEKIWQCGYVKKNTLASYAHVHFFGNMEFIKDIVKYDSEVKQ